MNKFTIRDNQGNSWTRITKAVARKAYNAGSPVVICPCNLHPFGGWNPSATIGGRNEAPEYRTDFDWRCDRYSDQFPSDKECGRYLSYYI